MNVDLVSDILFHSMSGPAVFSVIDYCGNINLSLMAIIRSVIIGVVVIKITGWVKPM